MSPRRVNSSRARENTSVGEVIQRSPMRIAPVSIIAWIAPTSRRDRSRSSADMSPLSEPVGERVGPESG